MAVKLVGFTGDTRGLEGRVAELAPVVVLSGESGEESGVLVASGLEWRTSTLKVASTGDDRFMSFTGSDIEISEGSTVWVAGAKYVRMLRSVSGLSDEAFKLGAWQTLAGGFRWSVGSRRAFAELFESIAGRLAVSMHKALFDPLEKSVGEARTLFELLEASVTVPSAERALDRALYFHETRDRDGYEWIREESVVVDALFDGFDSFDQEFKDRREWLLEARWSEGAKVPWIQPRTRAAFQMVADDNRLRGWVQGIARHIEAREDALH